MSYRFIFDNSRNKKNATKMSIEKATRHQICEEIRQKCSRYGSEAYIVWDEDIENIEEGKELEY